MTFLAALIAGVGGLFLAGFIAHACVSWYHIPSREGASGFFVIYGALGGGLLALLVGYLAARWVAARFGPGFGPELAGALVAVLGTAGLVAGICRGLADVAPTLAGRGLNLEVEFRFPASPKAGPPPTREGKWTVQLASIVGGTRRAVGDGRVLHESARLEAGRWIVPTTLPLFTERGRRGVALDQDGGGEWAFLVPLPARPGADFERWSDWLPNSRPGDPPWPADKMSYRFRIQKVPLPPPPPSDAEVRAERRAREEVAFAAIPADAPVQTWFPYLAYDQPLTRRALELISRRPGLVEELSRLVVGEDPQLAHAALCCIGRLPEPPKELIPVVQAAAREIADHISRFNRTSKEADPDFSGAVDPATRFYGWIPAVIALREKRGGDFIPELKTILELSRVRPESHCMRVDICRVASFHLQQWAGIAPLPTDPEF